MPPPQEQSYSKQRGMTNIWDSVEGKKLLKVVNSTLPFTKPQGRLTFYFQLSVLITVPGTAYVLDVN